MLRALLFPRVPAGLRGEPAFASARASPHLQKHERGKANARGVCAVSCGQGCDEGRAGAGCPSARASLLQCHGLSVSVFCPWKCSAPASFCSWEHLAWLKKSNPQCMKLQIWRFIGEKPTRLPRHPPVPCPRERARVRVQHCGAAPQKLPCAGEARGWWHP